MIMLFDHLTSQSSTETRFTAFDNYCRSLCEQSMAGCLPLMKAFGFQWPSHLNCSLFPNQVISKYFERIFFSCSSWKVDYASISINYKRPRFRITQTNMAKFNKMLCEFFMNSCYIL